MAIPLTIIVVGATGDLARRKIFAALFACFARGQLPDDVRFVGVARTELDDAAFRERLEPVLKCEELEGGVCSIRAGEFLRKCSYFHGEYASASDFRNIAVLLKKLEGGAPTNRVIYLAVPPFVFADAARAMADAGLLVRGMAEPWTRLVVEKPFGRDRASFDELHRNLMAVCDEAQTYRIDHYLGKEVVQNLQVLRFANPILDALWDGRFVHHVHIAWSEQQGVAGRAGYFDSYGIIRDVMQNHLLQILALIAMERPVRLDAVSIQNAKVALLRQTRVLQSDELLVGQYARSSADGMAGYREEPGVPSDSITPTYAAAVMHVDTPRWRGVPFLLTAGKGLHCNLTEVRLHFRSDTNALFPLVAGEGAGVDANELVIRVQPDEQIRLRIVSKIPGPGMRLGATDLDLHFRQKYPDTRIADAYENLLLDVVRGDRSLFIGSAELEAAWDLFTPVLHDLERRRETPVQYPAGGCGPDGVDALARGFGIPDAQFVAQL